MYVTEFDTHVTHVPAHILELDRVSNRLVLAKRPKPGLTASLLVLGDAAALSLSVTLSALLYLLLRPAVHLEFALQLWPFTGVFLLGFAAARLYLPFGLSPVEELRRLVIVISGGFVALVMALFILGELDTYSRGIFLLSWLSALLLVPLLRTLNRELFSRRWWWGAPVVVLGAAATARLVITRLVRQPGLGLKPIACFDDDAAKHGGRVGGVPVVGDLAAAREVARALTIRHAVVAMPGVQSEELAKLVQRYGDTFPYLFVIPNLFGLASMSISARELAGVIGIYTKQNLLIPANRVLKWLLDLLLLVPAVVLAAPVVALLALWIMAVSPGNPFYAQEREGFGGKRIRVWKLRSMHKNADELLVAHLARHPEAQREWERFYKLKVDPRILPGVGPLLRKTSLDELPQLWNIVRGDMSFVGPRPFPYYHLTSFAGDFRALRSSVRPGLTGLWQVSARSDGDLGVQEALDTYYIRNWSLWMDLYLLVRTPWAVIFGKGAY